MVDTALLHLSFIINLTDYNIFDIYDYNIFNIYNYNIFSIFDYSILIYLTQRK